MRFERLWTYENALVALLGMTLSVVFLERQAINLLMPFIVKDLGLSNAEAGALSSVISLTWAAGGFAAGRAADRTGRRKTVLAACVACYGVFCCFAGLASSFVALLAVRLGMGAAGGPVPTLSQLVMFEGSSAHRRGFNASMGTLVGGFAFGALPVALVALAARFGWRAAFLLSVVPALLVAGAILKFVREGAHSERSAPSQPLPAAPRASLGDLTRIWNVRICLVVATLLLAAGSVGGVFFSLFLVDYRGFTPVRMSVLTSVGGIAALTGAILLPALSDRIGRKAVVLAFTLLGICAPLACIYWTGSDLGLGTAVFIGTLQGSLPVIVMGTIPSESLPPRLRGTAIGLIMAVSEFLGGFLSPIGAGWLADRSSLLVPMYLQLGALVAATAFAALLQETAPAVVARATRRTHAPLSAAP